MRAVSVGETHPIVARQFKSTAWARMRHDLGARHAVGIELVVPRRIERVRPVNALAVTTDLDHLRTACICMAVRVRRTACNAADMDRAGKLRLPWIGDVVLT